MLQKIVGRSWGPRRCLWPLRPSSDAPSPPLTVFLLLSPSLVSLPFRLLAPQSPQPRGFWRQTLWCCSRGGGCGGGRGDAEQTWSCWLPSVPRGEKGSRGEFSYSSLTFSLAHLPKMLTMSTLKYVKLFYRLYRKDCHPPWGGLLASFLQRSIPHTLPGSSPPRAPGRVVLRLPVSPPSLLCFPAAAALPPAAEGLCHPSPVSVCVRPGRLNSRGLSGCPVRNGNEVRKLSKMEESQAEGLSFSTQRCSALVFLPPVHPGKRHGWAVGTQLLFSLHKSDKKSIFVEVTGCHYFSCLGQNCGETHHHCGCERWSAGNWKENGPWRHKPPPSPVHCYNLKMLLGHRH